MREKDIELYLRSQAKKRGCLCYKFTSPGRTGVPDDIVIWPNGDLHFLELKQPGGRLSPIQKEVLNRLTAHGQACFVAVGREDVDRYFNLELPLWSS